MSDLKAEIESDLEFSMENGGKALYEKEKEMKDKGRDPLSNKLIHSSIFNLSQTEKKFKEKIESMKDQCSKIDSYIINNLNQLDKFCYLPKDVLILIDVSDSMKSDIKKLEKAFKTANNFLELYISSDDRLGIFTYSSTINTILSLTEKNFNTYIYIKSLMEGLIQDCITGNIIKDFDKENQKDVNIKSGKVSNTCKALSTAIEYLNKKNPDPSAREKWVILFTDNFEASDDKDLKIFNELRENREKTKEQINVVVVGISMAKEGASRLKQKLTSISKKSDYIDFDNIGNFSLILKVHGDIKPDVEFANERYESDKIKRQ
jgi:hypothetical protein